MFLSSIPFPSIDPVFLRIGPLAFHWYGLAYLLGFIAAQLVVGKMIRRKLISISTEQFTNLMIWLVAGVLVGGRMGWWVIYARTKGDWPWYEPFAIWHGGMSFHGALAGVLMALPVWTRLNEVPFWPMADSLACVAPIGLFFGRLANFINAELVGRTTDLPWSVIFPGDAMPRHPSQLYEALLEGPFLWICLNFVRRLYPIGSGRPALAFLLLYGMFRFIVEFTRAPDPQIGYVAFNWLTMGQLLSAVMIAVGVALFVAFRYKHLLRDLRIAKCTRPNFC